MLFLDRMIDVDESGSLLLVEAYEYGAHVVHSVLVATILGDKFF